MADTKYTILGTMGAGKTCYIVGSYKAMLSKDVPEWSLEPLGDSNKRMINESLDKLRGRTGYDRYPAKTRNEVGDMRNLEFNLLYNNQKIINFDLMDYAGASIMTYGSVYEKLMKSILVSTVLYVLVDGKSLCDEDIEEREENFEYDFVKYVKPILQEYAREHKEKLPPIVFVVTKMDLLKKYNVSDNEIANLIKSYFDFAFTKGTTNYIVGVTLGEDISDDGNKGKFKPINMHIPVLIGSYHEFYNRYIILKNDIENANWQFEKDISRKESMADKEERKWKIFRSESYINNCRNSIQASKNGIKDNNKLLDTNKILLIKLGEYLKNNSNYFKTFIDGNEQDRFNSFI